MLTVASGAMVQLDGSGSSARDGGTIVSYRWARTGGSGDRTIVLTGEDSARPTFTAETLVPDSPDRTHVFTLTVTDDEGATSTDRVWVLVSSPIGIPLHCHHHNPIGYPVFPPNKRPVADAGPDHTVSRPMTVILDGSGSYDPDGTIVAFQWYQWTSDDGDLLPRGGGNSSTPRLNLKVAPPPPGNDDWIQYFCLVVWDNLGDKSWGDAVTITATSRTNADAGPDQTVASGALVMLDGSGSTADPRRTIASYGWVRTSGDATATLSGADTATPSFTAETLVDGAADATHVFTLTVTDSAGGTDTDTVTITVTSEFADPVAEAGDPQSVRAGATVTLDGSGSTVDDRRTITSYSWARTGGTSSVTGTLTGETTAKPSFTVEARDAGAPAVTHILTLTVTDSGGRTDTDTVTITVNAGLVAEAGDPQTADSGDTVTLDGTGTTTSEGSRIVTYDWERTDGTGDSSVTLTNANTLRPTFMADTLAVGAPAVTHVFTLTVMDNKGSPEATDTVTITVEAPLADLVAEAGDPQTVDSGDTVTLEGGGSTVSVGDRIVTYDWERTSGSSTVTVTLTGADTLQPTFTADTLAVGAPEVTHVFTLTVTDNKGSPEVTDTVTITVEAPFAALVAEAGDPQTVDPGDTVTLEGSGTATGGGRNVTYAWTQTGGDAATVTLSDTTVLRPTFTAQALTAGAADVTYEFTLRVRDDKGSTEVTDTVTITVKAPGFPALVAHAGPDQDNVASGASVTLDGSGSTPTGSGRVVSYAWTQTGGTTVTLADDTTLAPSFTADTLNPGDTDVTYEFTLRVRDDKGSTEVTDTVTITVKAPGFPALVAHAGPDQDNVASGASVTLDGSGSTPTGSGRVVSYAWTQTGGTTVTLADDTTLAPSFTADTLNPGDTDVTYEFTLRVRDDKGSTEVTDTVTITVKAPGFPALVAHAGPDQDNVASGASVTLDGSGSTPTGSGRVVSYAWTQTGGTTVTLADDTTLAPSFTADTLNPGDTDVTYEFTLRVRDDKGSTEVTDTVTITVKAPGFPALVAHAGPDQDNVASGASVTLDGSGSTPTGSGRVVSYAWTQTGGTTVTLADDTTLAPSFTADTLNPGDTDVTYEFTLRVRDDKGSTEVTDTVTITVKAPGFPALVAHAGPDQDNVASGASVTLDGSGSTPTGSGRVVSYAWTQTGGTTVTLADDTTLAPSFTADTLNPGDTDVTYEFTLRVRDDKGSTEVTDTVTITVKAPGFPALVAHAGPDQDNVASGASVTLDGSGSTPTGSGRVVSYAWTQTGGTTVTLADDTTLAPSFTADTLNPGDTDVTYEFTLRVRDDKGSTEVTDTVTITVKAPGFPALVAHAGPDQDNVASGASVTLDGSGSTPTGSGRVVSYAWTQTGGTTVTLADDTTLAPSFTADTLNPGDTDVTYEFTLRVRDDKGSTEVTDTVTITVKAPGFPALVAHAGPDQDNVASGASVTLDGSGSTPTGSGRVVSYAWTQTGGTTVTLADDTTLAPSFTADTLNPGDTDVTYEFTLRVRDDKGSTEVTDTVTITVKAPGFPALVAHAGPDQDNVASGASVTLDGSGSTPTGSGRVVSYAWTQTGGTTVTLADDTTLAPSFTADTLNPGDTDVTYEFTLRVRDDKGSTEVTDTVTITVKAPGFPALVAHAGPDQDNVASGASVTLDGSGSTPTGSGRVVSYAWTQTGGTTVTLADDTTLAPSFTADTLNPGDTDVTYEFTLRVRDDKGSTEVTDTVTITVKAPGFPALVAHAGPDQDNVASGASVTLDGSGSTPTGSGRVVSYAWTQTGGTTVTLADDTTLAPSFTADTLNPGDTDVTYEFTLRVRDDKGSTAATDTVTITVEAPFAALVAEAGDPQTADSGDTVTLDGTGTTTSVGSRIVTYDWERTSGSSTATVTLTGADTLRPTFTADTLAVGAPEVTHVFTLTVTDNKGSPEVTDTVTITVEAPFGALLAALVAEAGDPQTADSGDTVTLDGTGTTTSVGSRIVTYDWERTSGSSTATVTLTGADTLRPTFTADTLAVGAPEVTHVFTLTVTDNKGSPEATDTVTITVEAPFAALVAEAGDPQTVDSGDTVTLEGGGSTVSVGDRTVTYDWERTSGNSTATVTLTGANTLRPTFTADTLAVGAPAVTHVFTLTVTDNKGSPEATDMVTITVTSPNTAPLADAGLDQTVGSGTLVSLDGSGSTGVGRMIKYYDWTRMGGTGDSNMTLSGTDTPHPNFIADELEPEAYSVTHIFSLVVTSDDGMKSEADTVKVTVTSGFADPVAKVVSGSKKIITVFSGAEVQLDGSGSTVDRRRTINSYAWTRVSGTGDSALVLTGANTKQLSFKADTLKHDAKEVTHVFTLTVTDDAGKTDTATVTVKVVAVAQVEVDILVSHSELTVQEGDSSVYQVKLSESPRREVYVIARSDNENIVLENAQLTFNANNWDAWQEVKISSVSDPDKEDDKALIQHRLVAEGVTLGQSGSVIVTVREQDPVLRPIGEYLAARITALFNKQRKLIPFLKRDGSIPGGSTEFTFNATNGRMALDGRFVSDGIWGEITGSYIRSDFGVTKSVLGSFGLHWKKSERFLAGVMLQFDLSENDLAAGTGSIDGAGWLAGPYFAAGYDAHPIYVEGRLLYGQSDNDFWLSDPNLGKRSGSFNTRRLFAQLRMEGEISLSDEDYGPRLIPYADARWLKEHAKGFTDSLDKRVPGQKVGIGQLEFGSNVEIPIATTRGAMTFIGGLGVIYSDTEADYIRLESRGRGRGEMGFLYDRDDKVRIDFQSFYDGIGNSEYENYGLSLRAEMKF